MLHYYIYQIKKVIIMEINKKTFIKMLLKTIIILLISIFSSEEKIKIIWKKYIESDEIGQNNKE